MGTMKVVWTYIALKDLENAYEFVKQNNPKIAKEIVAKINSAIVNLKTYPNMGRKGRVEDTRELVIPNSPFFISYRITETQIEILAFLHGRRKWP